jgi:hypothetical protein
MISPYGHLTFPVHVSPSIGGFGGHALASALFESVMPGASFRIGASVRPPSVVDPALPAAASAEPPPDPPLPPLPAEPPVPPVDPPLPAAPPVLDPPDPPVADPPEPDIVVVLDVLDVLDPPLPPVADEPLLPAEPVVAGVALSSPPHCAAAIATIAIEGAIHHRMFIVSSRGLSMATIRTWIALSQKRGDFIRSHGDDQAQGNLFSH